MTKDFIEGNFLIAKFMGYDYPDLKNEVWRFSADDLHNYHEDWNKLMEVVEKINEWHTETMCKKMDFYLLNQSICSSKKMVREGCIEFIQWYNAKRLHNIKEKFNDIANGR